MATDNKIAQLIVISIALILIVTAARIIPLSVHRIAECNDFIRLEKTRYSMLKGEHAAFQQQIKNLEAGEWNNTVNAPLPVVDNNAFCLPNQISLHLI